MIYPLPFFRVPISVIILVAANLVPLAGVLILGWDLFIVMFLFWLESAVVGFYNILRMIRISPLGSISLVPFFIIHYGMFMMVHLVFLFAFFRPDIEIHSLFPPPSLIIEHIWLIFPAFLALLASHGYSYVTNFIGKKEYEKTNVKEQMHTPYKRIIVMHLAIIFGGFLMLSLGAPVSGVILLIALKTAVDVRAHIKEHGFILPLRFLPNKRLNQ